MVNIIKKQSVNITEDIYNKFPVILKEKIKNHEIEFPDDIQFQYYPLSAYRCVKREEDDFTPVSREDFKSYAELGRKNIRGMQPDIAKNPNYYGVSLFQTKEMVANAMKLPHPKKKIAAGFVFQEGGPQQTDFKTGHICWWLFEKVDLSNFKLVE